MLEAAIFDLDGLMFDNRANMGLGMGACVQRAGARA